MTVTDTPALSTPTQAMHLLAIAVLKKRITEHEQALRSTTADSMVVGERIPGLLDPGDKKSNLGFVQLAEGSTSARVTDEAKLLGWVEAEHPTEVVTVRQIRPAFRSLLLDEAKGNDGRWVDAQGELVPLPGVEVTKGDPSLRVTPGKGAAELVAAAVAAGRLAELTGGAA